MVITTITTMEALSLPIHPEADALPRYETDFDTLADSLRLKGMRRPVTLFNGEILDGRNRIWAADEAGLAEIPVELFEGTEAEALEFIREENFLTREWTEAEKLVCLSRLIKARDAALAAEGISMTEVGQARLKVARGGAPASDPEIQRLAALPYGSAREVAAQSGISPTAWNYYNAIEKAADSDAEAAEVLEDFKAGKTSLNKAYKVVKPTKKYVSTLHTSDSANAIKWHATLLVTIPSEISKWIEESVPYLTADQIMKMSDTLSAQLERVLALEEA